MVKPLFRLGMGALVLLVLRDARHTNFQNSILAMAETNISNGPIYFNCYPNFSVGLFDPNILDTLVLTIKTKNLEFTVDTKAIAVIYRVCYKTMSTTIEPKTKLVSPKDVTIVFESNPKHTQIRTPRRLKWNEITQSCNWNLQDILAPKPIEESEQISNIIEHEDGSVNINFKNLNAIPSSSSSRFTGSTSGTIHLETPHLIKSTSLKCVDFNRSIPRPLYQNEDTTSSTYSPTHSDFQSEVDRIKNQI